MTESDMEEERERDMWSHRQAESAARWLIRSHYDDDKWHIRELSGVEWGMITILASFFALLLKIKTLFGRVKCIPQNTNSSKIGM